MKFNSMVKYGLIGGLGFGLLQGCDDTTSISGDWTPTPSISGKAVSAESGKGIGGATVKLRINGQWYYTTTAGGTAENAGDFKFQTNFPLDSSFYIIIDPAQTEYANAYTYGNTVMTDGNQSADGTDSQTISMDIGNVAIYDAAETTITLMDVDTGDGIEGIGMWAEGANTGNSLIAGGSIAAPFMTPTTSTIAGQEGIYTWVLPDNQMPVDIWVNGLVDEDGNIYQTLAGDLLQAGNQDGDSNLGPNGTVLSDNTDNGGHADSSFTDRGLTSILPGVNSTIYLRRYSPSNLTVNFDLFDDDGAAFASAGRAIDVQETMSGQVFSAAQDSTVTNRYSITIPYRRDLSFAISSLDLNGDGFKDTQTTLVNSTVTRQSGVNSVNLAVSIDDLTDYTALTATVLSGSVTPGSSAEALVVFNQPVALTGDLNDTQAMFYSLDLSAAAEESDYIDPDGDIENSVGDPAVIAMAQQAAPDAHDYEYTDKNAATATFTLSGGRDSDGRFAEGYEKRVDSDITYTTGSAAQVNSAGNIFRITVSSTDIAQHQAINIAMSVRNLTTGEIENVSFNIEDEASTATFSALSDITIDDGNYIDNATDDPLTNLGSKPLYVTTDTDNLQTIPDTDTLSTCGASNCFFVAERAPTVDANVGLNDTLALVSPKAFYGHVKLVNYTLNDLDSDGNSQTTTTEFFDTAMFVYSENDELNELTNGGANNLCTPSTDCSEQGAYYYHLAIPRNHDVDDKADSGDALDDVFGSTVTNFATGYNKPEGLIYAVSLADLNLPTSTTDSILKTVTLDLDIIVDGVRQNGTVTLNVN